MLYTLNDISIIPAVISNIKSRKECNPYNNNMLPIFTAPMSSIIDENNYELFQENKINTIIPRNIPIETRLSLMHDTFIAVSLDEFEKYFCQNAIIRGIMNVCVDVANGHMQRLLDLCKVAKQYWGDNLQLMTGNVANPETYLEYAKIGIDYIRLGIGSGNVCTTSANNGIHYPMASLISKCVKHKSELLHFKNNTYNRFETNGFKSIPKIVADGGFQNYDQIIKALALGADYVMLGGIFAKCWEACGEIKFNVPMCTENEAMSYQCLYPNAKLYVAETKEVEFTLTRNYFGMSTKEAQKLFGKEGTTTAEGISKQVKIEYSLSGWIDNFVHYLRSTMSYTNCRTLEEFKKVKTEIISVQSFNSYYK